MHISRRLATGVASWLFFEYACKRGHLFSERYLSYAIGQVLYSEYGGKLVAELDHPILSEQLTGRGKRPKIDFGVLGKDKELVLALESKWVGSTVPKIEDIIWDLVRLEILAAEYKCDAFFLLAGQKRKIKALFDSKAFVAKGSNGKARPILKDGVRRSMGMRLDTPPKERVATVKKLVGKYPKISFPSKLSSGNPSIYPMECRNSDFQVYVWKIEPAIPRLTFKAESHKSYV